MLLNIPQNCAAQSVGLWLSSNRLDSPQRGRCCPLTRAAGSPFSLLSSKSAQVPGGGNTGRPLGNSHHYTILHPCRIWQKKPEGKLAHKSYPGISVKSPSRTQLTWHKNPSSRNCVRPPLGTQRPPSPFTSSGQSCCLVTIFHTHRHLQPQTSARALHLCTWLDPFRCLHSTGAFSKSPVSTPLLYFFLHTHLTIWRVYMCTYCLSPQTRASVPPGQEFLSCLITVTCPVSKTCTWHTGWMLSRDASKMNEHMHEWITTHLWLYWLQTMPPTQGHFLSFLAERLAQS